MQTLSKLFGSSARVKMIRLFIFNPSQIYEKKDIINRAKVSSESSQKELRLLHSIELIKKKTFYKEIKVGKKGEKKETKKKKTTGWILNKNFKFINELQDFFVRTLSVSDKEILQRLRPAIGQLKLVATAGVFIKDWESRVDILVVGDKIKEKQLSAIIRAMEAEIGRELRFCVFGLEDFKYRINVCDKLIRDIFDYEHRLIMDKIGMNLKK